MNLLLRQQVGLSHEGEVQLSYTTCGVYYLGNNDAAVQSGPFYAADVARYE